MIHFGCKYEPEHVGVEDLKISGIEVKFKEGKKVLGVRKGVHLLLSD